MENRGGFHGKTRALTASSVVETLGDALLSIKIEDRLRWTDLGETLGRSEDQAAKYADASATMDVVAFAKGRAAWGSRFTGGLDKLIEACGDGVTGHRAQSCILKSALALSQALEDGDLTDAEIRGNRSTLEASRDAIDALLNRLTPREVSR
jgi:hypothetical protein